MNGIVKSVNLDKGFGFITGQDGDSYFFHRTGVTEELAFNYYRKGMAVTFEPTGGPKGLRAEDVSPE